MKPWSCETRNCIWEKYFLPSLVRATDMKMMIMRSAILMILSLQSSLSITTMIPVMEMRVFMTWGSVWDISMRMVSTSLVM